MTLCSIKNVFAQNKLGFLLFLLIFLVEIVKDENLFVVWLFVSIEFCVLSVKEMESKHLHIIGSAIWLFL